jgi:hypothetical protein
MLKPLISKDSVHVERLVIERLADMVNPMETPQVEGEAAQERKDARMATDTTGILRLLKAKETPSRYTHRNSNVSSLGCRHVHCHKPLHA